MLERMWRNGNPLALLLGMQTGEATLENSVEVPQKIKVDLPYDQTLILEFRGKSISAVHHPARYLVLRPIDKD